MSASEPQNEVSPNIVFVVVPSRHHNRIHGRRAGSAAAATAGRLAAARSCRAMPGDDAPRRRAPPGRLAAVCRLAAARSHCAMPGASHSPEAATPPTHQKPSCLPLTRRRLAFYSPGATSPHTRPCGPPGAGSRVRGWLPPPRSSHDG